MLEIIDHGPIRELKMARPPVNALNPALVAALREAFESAPNQGAEGLILSGAQGLFSAGLDLPELLKLDRDAMREFWSGFFGLCAVMARCPVPIVAAVGGHSPAGGAVLALFSDYRIMAHGPFRIGLNEVEVGLVVPDCIQLALRRTVGRMRAERLLVSGAMLDSEQALAVGFVDELVGLEEVDQRAGIWLQELLAKPRHAMLATRALARADLADTFADPSALPVEGFLDAWFAPETQATMQQLVAQLKARKKL